MSEDLEQTRYIRELRRKIIKHFNLGELQVLCTDVMVKFDELPGDGLTRKANELLLYLGRRGRLDDLVMLLQEERPKVEWIIALPSSEKQIEDVEKLTPPAKDDLILREYLERLSQYLPSDALEEAKGDKKLQETIHALSMTYFRQVDLWRRTQLVRHLAEEKLLEVVSLAKVDLEGADLSGLNLKKSNLTAARLKNAFMEGVNLEGVNLHGAQLQDSFLAKANLRNADLRFVGLNKSVLDKASLQDTCLDTARLNNASMYEVQMDGAHGKNVAFIKVKLANASLKHTAFEGCDFEGAFLKGVQFQNARLLNCSFKNANLENANLASTEIQNSNFENADLKNAILETPDLLNQRAMVHLLKDNHQAALKDLTEALNIENQNINSLLNRGKLHILLENYDKALSDLTLACEIDGTEEHWFWQGIAYLTLGNIEQYSKFVGRAMIINRGNRTESSYTYDLGERALTPEAAADSRFYMFLLENARGEISYRGKEEYYLIKRLKELLRIYPRHEESQAWLDELEREVRSIESTDI